MSATSSFPRIGIALGGGAARGWSHIGVLQALRGYGIEPEIVCGTSIGALVGGIHAAGKLDALEEWVTTLTRRDVLGLVDFTVGGGGMIGGRKLMELYRRHLGDITIEDLPLKYAAVATDLHNGAEVWLRDGSLLDAIRASISVPGMFTPVLRNGRWIADGGMVNPIPVNVCRALGADFVIAVDLFGAAMSGLAPDPDGETHPAVLDAPRQTGSVKGIFRGLHDGGEINEDDPERPPGFTWVIQTALDIMQIRIGRARLAGDPPDLLLRPRVLQVQPLEFVGGGSTIEEGRQVVGRMMPALTDLLGAGR